MVCFTVCANVIISSKVVYTHTAAYSPEYTALENKDYTLYTLNHTGSDKYLHQNALEDMHMGKNDPKFRKQF